MASDLFDSNLNTIPGDTLFSELRFIHRTAKRFFQSDPLLRTPGYDHKASVPNCHLRRIRTSNIETMSDIVRFFQRYHDRLLKGPEPLLPEQLSLPHLVMARHNEEQSLAIIGWHLLRDTCGYAKTQVSLSLPSDGVSTLMSNSEESRNVDQDAKSDATGFQQANIHRARSFIAISRPLSIALLISLTTPTNI
ncbi:hypothetical protein NA56DRAFT_699537 [Hyaloscypha hepaticicola]|uniref:Uncharacterized protein n=1 Tax=Hyaloscypha hepaticicola TaxID=2082293 RepID=A0A2J6QH75_9HELO|nr:hypothetical protein NA56DRAFT_699537 [Hyaloscypha hepaticicola]